jgi:hypothetical protein
MRASPLGKREELPSAFAFKGENRAGNRGAYRLPGEAATKAAPRNPAGLDTERCILAAEKTRKSREPPGFPQNNI